MAQMLPPSSITCYSSHLSHIQFPISLPPSPLGSARLGPLTSSTVASSITIQPEDNHRLATLDILSITSLPSPEAPMLRVQYRNEGPASAILGGDHLAAKLRCHTGAQVEDSETGRQGHHHLLPPILGQCLFSLWSLDHPPLSARVMLTPW